MWYMMRERNPPIVVSVGCVGLKPFLRAFDRLMGFPRAELFFRLLLECSLGGLSLEALCNRKFESPDRLFFYMSRIEEERIAECVNMLLGSAFDVLKKRWRGRKVYVAIDYNDIEYYGRVDDRVFYTVKRNGSQYQKVKVLRYATIAVVARRFKFTLAVLPVKKTDKPENIVERLLLEAMKHVTIRTVLMDRGFYNSRVMTSVEALGLHYIIPIKRTRSMDLYYWLSTTTGKWHWKYHMNQGTRDDKEVTVYLKEEAMTEYIGVVSNKDMGIMDAELLFQAYNLRWNQENSYKESTAYQLKTSSQNHSYRLLIYGISHFMMNLQGIARRINKARITTSDMKLAFHILLTQKQLPMVRLTKNMFLKT